VEFFYVTPGLYSAGHGDIGYPNRAFVVFLSVKGNSGLHGRI